MGAKNKLTAEEKKNKRLMKWLMSLNREQKQLLTEYCNEQSKSDIVAHFYAYERVLRPALYALANNDIIETEKILAEIVRQVGIEGLNLHNFKNGSVEYMKKIDEVKQDIINKYNLLKTKGKNEKDVLADLKVDYPTLTVNSIKNIILEYKRDKAKEEIANGNTEAAVDYIFSEKEESKETTEEPKKEKFKVLKKTVIVDVAGEFGEYHIENGAVSSKGMVMKNSDEVKKVFDDKKKRSIDLIDREANEVLELMEMYK
ncbi:MAG: hypothetical protein ACLSTJ_07875 [Clostridium neonatale]